MRYISVLIILASFLVACNQNDPTNESVTDEGYTQLNQPSGSIESSQIKEWDQEVDTETIEHAAEQVPDVDVRSIHIKNNMATVYVNVTRAMDQNEEHDWEETVSSAIRGMIPRYDIKVVAD
ncbi:hypothetical protein NC661_10330 [Aquibacillus koreensis]|uniref:BON domain-containing protein n=1 Tax=Aquibacillus koreensis TaxID=279446 RepID=A0A9X3WNX3_9BACI|nr:hypothetical protein [Aquibacillus koreensis]MCT2538293.1 hypothetical protein [Aquibacillus koreensis]MDC3420764.1 hypothetical protein [Aquibacillus koreensis]